VTQIDGCVLLNSVTARLMPGTQAQNVIFVALELHDAPPASTDALGLALLLAPLPEPLVGALVPQAASTETAASPASPTVARPAAARGMRGEIGARGRRRAIDLDNIVAKLPCCGVAGTFLSVRAAPLRRGPGVATRGPVRPRRW
jgi:hypothetical protein